MKRRLAGFGLLAVFLSLVASGGGSFGQPKVSGKKESENKAADTAKADAVMRVLNLRLDMKDFQSNNPLAFKEFLALLVDKVAAKGGDLPILLDTTAFAAENPDAPNPNDAPINFPPLPRQMTVANALRTAIGQLPTHNGALVIRGGQVEIVTANVANRDSMLAQTFFANFSKRPLDEALDELSELTGVTIVLDPRAKEKGHLPVTARFHNDVAVQDAVRLLVEMADLKLVQMPTALYATTAEHAQVLQKELDAMDHPKTGYEISVLPGMEEGAWQGIRFHRKTGDAQQAVGTPAMWQRIGETGKVPEGDYTVNLIVVGRSYAATRLERQSGKAWYMAAGKWVEIPEPK